MSRTEKLVSTLEVGDIQGALCKTSGDPVLISVLGETSDMVVSAWLPSTSVTTLRVMTVESVSGTVVGARLVSALELETRDISLGTVTAAVDVDRAELDWLSQSTAEAVVADLAGERVCRCMGVTVRVFTTELVTGSVHVLATFGETGVDKTMIWLVSVSGLEVVKEATSNSEWDDWGDVLGPTELGSARDVAKEMLEEGSCGVGEGILTSVPGLATAECVTSGDISDVMLEMIVSVVWEDGLHGAEGSVPSGETVHVEATALVAIPGLVNSDTSDSVPRAGSVPEGTVEPSPATPDVVMKVTWMASVVAV